MQYNKDQRDVIETRRCVLVKLWERCTASAGDQIVEQVCERMRDRIASWPDGDLVDNIFLCDDTSSARLLFPQRQGTDAV